ncbi:DUF1648 domain-containing protein [Chondrinema litorale]|uniref:DUF1648 domain-containing protein n=1 Tax=Chondrinema litorale TaxID=2994555 RepID=UPI0025428197|nr:DUF1648 domain-containing protein [Chondrinema litorale]UZR97023.1 DUF1648 domain-containing protein [Chondrinema litorale]
MTRPKIYIKRTAADYLMEAIGVLAIIWMFINIIMHYGSLPETIPSHFNIRGNVDNYSSKISIWFLPIVSMVLFISLFFMTKFPHNFNYPTKITESNAEGQYKKATRLIRYINAIIAILFAYISYQTVQIALGNQESLGSGFLIFLLIGLFSGITLYYIFSKRNKVK